MPAVPLLSPAWNPRSALVTLIAVLSTAVVGLLLGGVPALAHSALVSSSPAAQEQVTGAPETVTLTFSDDIQPLGTEVVVSGSNGANLAEGDVAIAGPEVTQSLAAQRPAGAYTVTWRAVSADGHPISGEFTFTASDAVGVVAPNDAVSGGASAATATEATATATATEATATATEATATATATQPDPVSGLTAGTKTAVFILIALAVLGGVAATIMRVRRNRGMS